MKNNGNYSSMLIGLSIVIICLLARKITAECAEVRRVAAPSASLCALYG